MSLWHSGLQLNTLKKKLKPWMIICPKDLSQTSHHHLRTVMLFYLISKNLTIHVTQFEFRWIFRLQVPWSCILMNHCATNVNFRKPATMFYIAQISIIFFKGRIQTTENAIGLDQTQSQSGSNPAKTFSYEQPTNISSGKQKVQLD